MLWSCCSFGEVLEGIHITMPYTIGARDRLTSLKDGTCMLHGALTVMHRCV
jgi:hypothetical protein